MRYFARVALTNKEGKFLMLHNVARNRWEFPGGKVEDDESPVTAAIRETTEEIGVRPSLLTFVTTKRIIIDGNEWRGSFYTTTFWEGEPRVVESKADDIRWVTIREMADLPSIPSLSVDIAREIYG